MNCPICNQDLVEGADLPIIYEGRQTGEMWGPAHFWCPACQLPFIKERVRSLPADERPFAQGDHVRVQGAAGDVLGHVIHACTPYEMPHLGPGTPSHEAHQIMHEWGVDFVLLIHHSHDDRQQCFFALRYPGGWRDLYRQELQISKVEDGGKA